MHPHLHGPRALALIAIFKFAKVAMLIVLAAILFHLSTPEAIGAFADWLRALPLATGHQYVGRAVSAVTDMNPHTVGLFAIVALVSPMAADQAYALKAGDPTVVSNAPIPDTKANRARYGSPLSTTGRKTAPAGN